MTDVPQYLLEVVHGEIENDDDQFNLIGEPIVMEDLVEEELELANAPDPIQPIVRTLYSSFLMGVVPHRKQGRNKSSL